MRGMQAGKLDQRVTLQVGARQDDDRGGHKMTWSDLAQKLWASIEPIPGAGGESVEGDQVRARSKYLVTIRYREGITTQHRFKHRGRFLQVDSVPRVSPRDQKLELVCIETQE